MHRMMHRTAAGVAIVASLVTPSAGAGAQGPARPRVTQPPRHGVVHGIQHAFADDGGMFLARGATMFWALWGYQHDRDRLGRNLTTLRGWNVDYIRVLGVVGAPGDQPGDSWRDRRIDPSAESYD